MIIIFHTSIIFLLLIGVANAQDPSAPGTELEPLDATTPYIVKTPAALLIMPPEGYEYKLKPVQAYDPVTRQNVIMLTPEIQEIIVPPEPTIMEILEENLIALGGVIVAVTNITHYLYRRRKES